MAAGLFPGVLRGMASLLLLAIEMAGKSNSWWHTNEGQLVIMPRLEYQMEGVGSAVINIHERQISVMWRNSKMTKMRPSLMMSVRHISYLQFRSTSEPHKLNHLRFPCS